MDNIVFSHLIKFDELYLTFVMLHCNIKCFKVILEKKIVCAVSTVVF